MLIRPGVRQCRGSQLGHMRKRAPKPALADQPRRRVSQVWKPLTASGCSAHLAERGQGLRALVEGLEVLQQPGQVLPGGRARHSHHAAAALPGGPEWLWGPALLRALRDHSSAKLRTDTASKFTPACLRHAVLGVLLAPQGLGFGRHPCTHSMLHTPGPGPPQAGPAPVRQPQAQRARHALGARQRRHERHVVQLAAKLGVDEAVEVRVQVQVAPPPSSPLNTTRTSSRTAASSASTCARRQTRLRSEECPAPCAQHQRLEAEQAALQGSAQRRRSEGSRVSGKSWAQRQDFQRLPSAPPRPRGRGTAGGSPARPSSARRTHCAEMQETGEQQHRPLTLHLHIAV
jgi:hypothetical protein